MEKLSFLVWTVPEGDVWTQTHTLDILSVLSVTVKRIHGFIMLNPVTISGGQQITSF